MIGIKNLTMPRTCIDCPLLNEYMFCQAGSVDIWEESFKDKEFKPDKERFHDCPLIEIERNLK